MDNSNSEILNCQVQFLQFLFENNCLLTEDIFSKLAKYGNLDIITPLHI